MHFLSTTALTLVASGLAGSALAQTSVSYGQMFIGNPRFVEPGGGVSTINPGIPFDVGHPGYLEADLTFRAPGPNAQGTYDMPSVEPLWAVRNKNGEHPGEVEWHGTQDDDPPLLITAFNPLTGVTTVELSVPVGLLEDGVDYPFLPMLHTEFEILLGLSGSIGLDTSGYPVGVDWGGVLDFDTNYPDMLVLLDREVANVGDEVAVQLVFPDAIGVDTTFNVNVSGPGMLANGPDNSGSYSVTIGKSVSSAFVLYTASQAGLYSVTVTGPGLNATSQVGYLEGDFSEEEEIEGTKDEAESRPRDNSLGDVTVSFGNGKRCRKAYADDHYGERLYKCTGRYIELLESPPDPDCTAQYIGWGFSGKCLPAHEESFCTMPPGNTSKVETQKYKNEGTVTEELGKVKVKVKAETGAVAKHLIDVGVEGEVESRVIRKCCKALPVPGEKGKITKKDCVGDTQ